MTRAAKRNSESYFFEGREQTLIRNNFSTVRNNNDTLEFDLSEVDCF
jgi:hypothetical protein